MPKNLVSDGTYFPDFDTIAWPLPLPIADGSQPSTATDQEYVNMLLALIGQLQDQSAAYQQFIDYLLGLLRDLGEVTTCLEYQSDMVSPAGGIDCMFTNTYTNVPAYYIQPAAAGSYIKDGDNYIGIHIDGETGVIYSLVAYIAV